MRDEPPQSPINPTDSPRTDAADICKEGLFRGMIFSDFARQLERELAAKEKERDSWHTLFRQVDSYACALIKDGAAQKESVLGTIMEHVARQEKELAELRGGMIWIATKSGIDGFGSMDLHEEAIRLMPEHREEPNDEDYLNALKKIISAMKGQNEC